MAKKKFLQENNNQIWPITRIDCVYTKDGNKLLKDDVLTKEDIDAIFLSDAELNEILSDLFYSNWKYSSITEELTVVQNNFWIYDSDTETLSSDSDAITYDALNEEINIK
jgi:hypothetical protein